MSSGMPASEDAAAEEGAFERIIAVVAAASETGHFASCIQARNRFALLVQHL